MFWKWLEVISQWVGRDKCYEVKSYILKNIYQIFKLYLNEIGKTWAIQRECVPGGYHLYSFVTAWDL